MRSSDIMKLQLTPHVEPMKLSIIGLGKLGSPLAAVLASKGHQVIGVDLNPEFVKKINTGIAPVSEPSFRN